MNFTNRMVIIALPAAAALGLLLSTASLGWNVPSVQAASGPIDAQATEIVRLINGARATEGKPALLVDTFLASKARDGAIPCPDNAAETIPGRARDFATSGILSHYLRLCDAPVPTLSGTKYVSVLQAPWSYGAVGEIDLLNVGYGTGQYLYTIGAWQTWTYATSGHALMAWQTSPSHWNIVIGSYDRVGCGGWMSNDGVYFYDCTFAQGGPSPSGLMSPPTTSPFSDPVPSHAPGSATAPVPTSTASVPPVSNGTPLPAATRAVSRSTASNFPTPRSASPTDMADPARAAASPARGELVGSSTASTSTPSVGVGVGVGIVDDRAGAGLAGSGTRLPILIAQEIALGAGSGAALLAAWSALLMLRRRRAAFRGAT